MIGSTPDAHRLMHVTKRPVSNFHFGRVGVQIAILPAAAAWGVLSALPLLRYDLQICANPIDARAASFQAAMTGQLVVFQPQLAIMEWVLMIVAMMAPLVASDMDHVKARTYRRDQARVIGVFFTGFLVVWLLLGPAMIAATMSARAAHATLGPVLGSPVVPLILAAIWMVSETRRGALARCHFRPTFASGGHAAYLGALKYGLSNASFCVLTCLPLMLAMQVAGGGLIGMALLAVIILAERSAHKPDSTGAAIILIIYGIVLTLL